MIEKIYEHEACCFYFFTLISFQHIAWLASFFVNFLIITITSTACVLRYLELESINK